MGMTDSTENKKLRSGFTTGSCAAAASKAAVWMLLSGNEKSEITIETPKKSDIMLFANVTKEKLAEFGFKERGPETRHAASYDKGNYTFQYK